MKLFLLAFFARFLERAVMRLYWSWASLGA